MHAASRRQTSPAVISGSLRLAPKRDRAVSALPATVRVAELVPEVNELSPRGRRQGRHRITRHDVAIQPRTHARSGAYRKGLADRHRATIGIDGTQPAGDLCMFGGIGQAQRKKFRHRGTQAVAGDEQRLHRMRQLGAVIGQRAPLQGRLKFLFNGPSRGLEVAIKPAMHTRGLDSGARDKTQRLRANVQVAHPVADRRQFGAAIA